VLNVTQAEQTFIFDNVYFQPVPALLCEFSAPVKLEYKWSDQQLTFLMRHAQRLLPLGCGAKPAGDLHQAQRKPPSAGPAAVAACPCG
jgi:aminopeptidase N